jgi:hypothetical protein
VSSSEPESSLATVLARKAAGDAKVVRRLAGDPEIDDEAIGLDARQAIEEWMKAVIGRGIEVKSRRAAVCRVTPAVDGIHRVSDPTVLHPPTDRMRDIFSPPSAPSVRHLRVSATLRVMADMLDTGQTRARASRPLHSAEVSR